MSSPKELSINEKILSRLSGRPAQIYQALVADEEVAALQEYANVVSIKRLGFNDHGPVHMRKVTMNGIRFMEILQAKGIPLNLEKEEIGTYEDSLSAVILACFLHDVGMSIGRAFHENSGIWLSQPIIERILLQVYPESLAKRVILRSIVMEAIMGHMATIPIHSLEAGVLLLADGCDMEKGRARIPLLINTEAKVGDIHKYSSSAVDKVFIVPGEERPIRIQVVMNASVGFFQVEEVLFPKIRVSPLKPYIELQAGIEGREFKTYL